jgi:hypothetical protein
MKSEIIDHINQAFLQLEFSIKLLTYAELREIDKEEFDTDLLIGQGDLSFSHSTFDTYEDLMLAAHNNFNITVGFTAIVLDSSFNSVGILPNPNDRSPEGALRALIYMIRCAYAHNMMYPKWEVKGPYAQILEVPLRNEILKLDLTQKHGAPFDMQDIGGYKNYFNIKDSICELILNY